METQLNNSPTETLEQAQKRAENLQELLLESQVEHITSKSMVDVDQTAWQRMELAADNFIKSGIVYSEKPVDPVERTKAQTFLKIALGYELGLPTIHMREMHIMPAYKDKKGYVRAGNIQVGVHAYEYKLQGGGVKTEIVEWDEKICHLILHRQGWKSVAGIFTIEMAKAKWLVKDNTPWKSDPAIMLYSRAYTRAAKIIGGDLLGGLGSAFTPEEIDELDAMQAEAIEAENSSGLNLPPAPAKKKETPPKAKAKPKAKPKPTIKLAPEITPAKLGEIKSLKNKLQPDEVKWKERLKATYIVDDEAKLTLENAQDLIGKLETSVDAVEKLRTWILDNLSEVYPVESFAIQSVIDTTGFVLDEHPEIESIVQLVKILHPADLRKVELEIKNYYDAKREE